MTGTSGVRTVAVLGAGRVGSLIARDLAGDASLRVRLFDRSEEALGALEGVERLECCAADLSDEQVVRRSIREADLVVGAVPGALGHRVLGTTIDEGRSVVDISFSPEDPAAFDAEARRKEIPAVVDCGVAPGLSNWFVGRSQAELDQVDEVEILVGGLPFRRVWPYEYRSVFSPTDVIEEYTRPCRMRVDGREIVVPALTDIEHVEHSEVGTLEAFNTDGLRTLLRTVDAPTLKEKTLRYPGHAERMRALRESGFFDERPRRVGEVEVAPRALTEALLFDAWRPDAGEEEFTLLKVRVAGRRGGRPARIEWELFDRTDRETGATSMARTTGFPCAIAARMLLDGAWREPGVHPPEILGRDESLTGRMLAELARRSVRVERTDRAS